jgi:hypothetical protein
LPQTQPKNDITNAGETPDDRYDENLNITTQDAYADATATIIPAQDMDKGIITILSKHATNAIKYKIRGSIKFGAAVPADADKNWFTLVAETIVGADQAEPKHEAWSEPWAWIRVDVKASVGGSQGTVDVLSRGVDE